MQAAHASAPSAPDRTSIAEAGSGQSRPESAPVVAWSSVDLQQFGIRGCGEGSEELLRICEYFDAEIESVRQRMCGARTEDERENAAIEYHTLCGKRYFHMNGELSSLSGGKLDWYAEDYPRYLDEGPIKADYVSDSEYREWRRQARESVTQLFGDDLSNLTYPATVVHRFYEVWEDRGRPRSKSELQAIVETLLTDPSVGAIVSPPSEFELRRWLTKRYEAEIGVIEEL